MVQPARCHPGRERRTPVSLWESTLPWSMQPCMVHRISRKFVTPLPPLVRWVVINCHNPPYNSVVQLTLNGHFFLSSSIITNNPYTLTRPLQFGHHLTFFIYVTTPNTYYYFVCSSSHKSHYETSIKNLD